MHTIRKRLLRTAAHLGDRLRIRTEAILRKKSFKEANKELRDLSFERWKNFTDSRIDWDRTLPEGNRLKFLRNVYDGLVTGIHLKPTDNIKFEGEFSFKYI